MAREPKVIADFFESRKRLEDFIENTASFIRQSTLSIALSKDDNEFKNLQKSNLSELENLIDSIEDEFSTERIVSDFLGVLMYGHSYTSEQFEQVPGREVIMINSDLDSGDEPYCIERVEMRTKQFISAFTKACSLDTKAISDFFGATVIVQSRNAPRIDYIGLFMSKDKNKVLEAAKEHVAAGLFTKEDLANIKFQRDFSSAFETFDQIYAQKVEPIHIKAMLELDAHYKKIMGKRIKSTFPMFFYHKDQAVDFSYQKILYHKGESKPLEFNLMVGYCNDHGSLASMLSSLSQKSDNGSAFDCSSLKGKYGGLFSDGDSLYFVFRKGNAMYAIRSDSAKVSKEEFKEHVKTLKKQLEKQYDESDSRIKKKLDDATGKKVDWEHPNVQHISSLDYEVKGMNLAGYEVASERSRKERNDEFSRFSKLHKLLGIRLDKNKNDLADAMMGKYYIDDSTFKRNKYGGIHHKTDGMGELKLRTSRMHFLATVGSASHASYKQKEGHKKMGHTFKSYEKHIMDNLDSYFGKGFFGKDKIKRTAQKKIQTFLSKYHSSVLKLFKRKRINSMEQLSLQPINNPIRTINEIFSRSKWVDYYHKIEGREHTKIAQFYKNVVNGVIDQSGLNSLNVDNEVLVLVNYMHKLGVLTSPPAVAKAEFKSRQYETYVSTLIGFLSKKSTASSRNKKYDALLKYSLAVHVSNVLKKHEDKFSSERFRKYKNSADDYISNADLNKFKWNFAKRGVRNNLVTYFNSFFSVSDYFKQVTTASRRLRRLKSEYQVYYGPNKKKSRTESKSEDLLSRAFSSLQKAISSYGGQESIDGLVEASSILYDVQSGEVMPQDVINKLTRASRLVDRNILVTDRTYRNIFADTIGVVKELSDNKYNLRDFF